MFTDNKDFYPTPDEVIEIMIEGEVLNNKILLIIIFSHSPHYKHTLTSWTHAH